MNVIKNKYLQLLLSTIIVFVVSFIYGGHPEKWLPTIFNFEVQNLELKNIFRAIMGLYLAFALYWALGIKNERYWAGATISNIVFMGGLAFGRLISTLFDGWSTQFGIGMVLEFFMMLWGIWNLKTFENTRSTN